MRKLIALLGAVVLALVAAPALWGLPPPGDAVSVELAEIQRAEEWINLVSEEPTRAEVATERLATSPLTGVLYGENAES